MKKVFFRCNDGHYFHGPKCPWDAWSVRGDLGIRSEGLLQAILDLRGEELSVAVLRRMGVTETALASIIIVEFAGSSSEFDGFVVERVRHNDIDYENFRSDGMSDLPERFR